MAGGIKGTEIYLQDGGGKKGQGLPASCLGCLSSVQDESFSSFLAISRLAKLRMQLHVEGFLSL